MQTLNENVIEREIAIAVRPRVEFFGSLIDPLTMEETLEHVERIIAERRITQHVVVNVAKLVMMQKDEALREIVNSCELINADGQGIVWGANLLDLKIPERVAGIDLFENIVARSPQKKWRPYFLGARQEIVQKVVAIFRKKYPMLEVAGFRDGYFNREQEQGVAEAIRDSGADVLFVAMGSPQKEIFLNRYVDMMGVPFVMGVGGSFDVVAGHVKRAPVWMQKAGLEWFYRFACEPGRMWKRYLVTNVIFLGMILKAVLKKRR